MSHIKYTLNDNVYTCWNSTDRVTTPSLIFNENETTRYTPLFVIDENKEGTLDQHWFYKCGDLSVNYDNQKYYAPLSRRYINTISDTISTTIKHSGKTGTTTTYPSRTVTKDADIILNGYISPGGGQICNTATINYGITFSSTPSVSVRKGTVITVTSSYCIVRACTDFIPNSGTSQNSHYETRTVTISATGPVATTTTTYPDETHSANAQGNFNYGVTYPTEPVLTVDSGGVTVTNNTDNSSCLIEKMLKGTVAYNKTATLSQAFSVTHKGEFGLN